MTSFEIADMRTEGRINPLGLDIPAPLFAWSFARVEERGRQSAYRIVAASSEEGLAGGVADVWDSGVVSGAEHTSIRYAGEPLLPRRRYYWRVTVWDSRGDRADSGIAWWETGQLDPGNWTGRWIGWNGDGAEAAAAASGPLPLLRREFDVRGPIRRARAYVSGPGHYELRLNGSKVGDSELDPGWTEYDKTVLYSVYDIAPCLKQGRNAAGLMLGNGFYNVAGGRYTKFKDSYGAPIGIADLVIEYEDGTADTIGSDASWTAAAGPLVFSCIYGGEDYDARLERSGWDRAGFVGGTGWSPAAETPAPRGALLAQAAPPLRVTRRFEPASVSEPKPGVFVYDFGQNFSGWPELTVSGPAGAAVKLTPAELLTEEGLADQRWSGSPHELNYTLKGEGDEVWRPRFTYYGFRYVQVEGAVPAAESGGTSPHPDRLPALRRIEGQMIAPDIRTVGGFRCSDGLLNRIHEIIDWAILGNTKSVFTDCPHREKLGWLEQVHLMGPSVMYNYDIEALLGKVMNDMADAQQPDGLVPTTAPEYVVFREPWSMFRESTPWGGAYILAAWEMLQRYGARAALERHYGGMKRYLDYLAANADGHIIRTGLGDWYDIGPDGPGFSQNTPVPLAETATYYGLAVVMGKIAALLGQPDDSAAFARRAGAIKEAFNAAFFDPQAGAYAEGSDAAQAMPLAIGLVPEAHRAAVLERLVANIEGRGDQTTAGDVGHRYVLLALARGGRPDLIVPMARNTETPGYGFQIAAGATTLTEAWEGPTVGKSQNHFMLGHLEEWLYGGLAGLDYRYRPEAGRFGVTIKPFVADGIDWAEAWHELRAGRTSVRWERAGGRSLTVTAEIPFNAEATIHVPARSAEDVSGGGPGAERLGWEDGYAVFRTGSGAFAFTSEI